MLDAPAPQPARAEPSFAVLVDAWRPDRPVILDGWFERNGFSPVLLALLATVAGFLVFQTLAAVVGIVLVIGRVGVENALDVTALVTEHIDLMIIGNTAGQFVGLGLFTLVLARLHARRPWGFVRARGFDSRLLGLSVLGLLFLMPLVQWLGELNAQLPLPEFLEALEQQQLDLIESLLSGRTGFWFNLFALAVTPALCEEFFFRGYLQRQLERAGGAIWGIVLTGVIFGFYHLRLTQALPLAVLGVYLCYVTWRTGSILPAVLLHLIHNGAALLASEYVARDPSLDLETVDNVLAPWYIVLPGVLLLGVTLRMMQQRARTRIGEIESSSTLASQSTLP